MPAFLLALPISCTPPSPDTACAAANRPITLGSLYANSMSGTYDVCLDQLRTELASLRLASREMEARATELNRASAKASAESAAAARRLASITAAQAEIARSIAEQADTKIVNERELRRVLAEEERLRSQIDGLSEPGSAEADELANRQEALRRRVEGL
jgi:chromosome segregation ATPase